MKLEDLLRGRKKTGYKTTMTLPGKPSDAELEDQHQRKLLGLHFQERISRIPIRRAEFPKDMLTGMLKHLANEPYD